MWSQRFRVRGAGSFPTDMLRYDGCFPASQQAASQIDGRQVREVELQRYTATKLGAAPTEARWESFGWHVTSVDQPFKV